MRRFANKWVTLPNTTVGTLLATVNWSILLTALPDIFRGIGIDRLIVMRVGQGVGGALLSANSSAILTDAFPVDRRGLALGGNSMAAIAGSFACLVLGGVLAPVSWRLVFAVGLVGVMVGITYGIQPYDGYTMWWASPFVLSMLISGVAVLVAFSLIEQNSAGMMDSLAPGRRGAGAGMLATFMNTASVLSIGVFFSFLVVGLSSDSPSTLMDGLTQNGVSATDEQRLSSLPPVATLFGCFLGYNVMATLLEPDTLSALPPAQAHQITGRSFFPRLISGPFHTAFGFAFVACVVAAATSSLRGGEYYHEEGVAVPVPTPTGIESAQQEISELPLRSPT